MDCTASAAVHRGAVDLMQDDRMPLRGDPAGEAGAHGDTDALADLVLDAAGSRGHQLAARVIEQQHDRRVGTEDGLDPVQQDVQQLLLVEAGQRHVGERLDVLQPVKRAVPGNHSRACT
jgi:hypothetical protein